MDEGWARAQRSVWWERRALGSTLWLTAGSSSSQAGVGGDVLVMRG